ncbi:MAG: PspC domain-containing protein [Candidatus Pacebacteria bacterium]|nr:PspC domain-containing protein [Candidatus Paceibacterota bacterium]
MKTLKRKPQKAMIAGVIAGFAEYFVIDVTVLRVLFLAALLVTGFFPLGLAYILSIFIMPIDTSVPAEPVIHVHADEKSQSNPSA